MKSLIFFSCVVVFVNAVDKAIVEELMEKLQEVGVECAETENTPPKDIEALMNNQLPSTHEGKCTIYCIMKRFHLMNEDTSFGPGWTEWLEKLKADDEDIYYKFVGVHKSCQPQVQNKDDGCERSFEYAQCSKDEGIKLGLDKIFQY